MHPRTRQTILGNVAVLSCATVGIAHGLNGEMTSIAIVAIVAISTPEAIDSLAEVLPYAEPADDGH